MVYWMTSAPKEEDYSETDFSKVRGLWALQQMARRNAAKYTTLLVGGKQVKVKFVGEVLKDPDGNTPSMGQIHGRPEIPALSARFELVGAKKPDSWGMVLLTDEYLASRKQLDIKESSASYDNPKRLPKDIVKKLEQQYGMKAERSCEVSTIGGKYVWGSVQFQGAYPKAPKDKYDPDRKFSLALDVLIDGDKVYTHESLGHWDESGATWNADDDGMYIPNSIEAAFEGPKGLELCYTHGAPESFETGMIYVIDGKLVECMYEMYQTMIDEQIPVWKKDIAEMNKLFLQKDPSGHKGIKLTKWAHIWMDDYETEWIHLMDKDEQYGGIFVRKNGKIRLVQVENPKRKFLKMEANGIAYLKYAGPAGGPTWATEIYGYKGGKQVEHFEMLEVEGEIDGCGLNDKEMTPEQGRAYVNKFADAQPLNQSWTEPGAGQE